MLKLYYTSKKGKDELQSRPDLSLGGFKSATAVPNGSVNNLFSDISLYSVVRGQNEFIALIIKNEGSVALPNLKLWFNFPANCQREVEVAAVELSVDGSMEGVESPYNQPYHATFHKANGEENKVELGDLDADEELGLWFKGIVDKEAIKERYSDEKLYEDGNPKEEDEDIEIIFEWGGEEDDDDES